MQALAQVTEVLGASSSMHGELFVEWPEPPCVDTPSCIPNLRDSPEFAVCPHPLRRDILSLTSFAAPGRCGLVKSDLCFRYFVIVANVDARLQRVDKEIGWWWETRRGDRETDGIIGTRGTEGSEHRLLVAASGLCNES